MKTTGSRKIVIHDASLRDGNHAIGHQLDAPHISEYCRLAERAGVPVVEVGHGNGLGASSFQVGISKTSDHEALLAARSTLKKTKLAVYSMPGFSTIDRNLAPAIHHGADVVRVGTHCTESDCAERHIKYAVSQGIETAGSLMMSHMVDEFTLEEQAKKLEGYGATAVSLYDSAGAYLPSDVQRKVSHLRNRLSIKVGFHAHNNLGMAVANSLAAVDAGASIIDGSILGFGAGAGNAQLEVLAAVFTKLGVQTSIDLFGILDCATYASETFATKMPTIKGDAIVSGLAGVFSGFAPHIRKLASQNSVDSREVIMELGKRGVIGGQEDLIVQVVQELSALREDS